VRREWGVQKGGGQATHLSCVIYFTWLHPISRALNSGFRVGEVDHPPHKEGVTSPIHRNWNLGVGWKTPQLNNPPHPREGCGKTKNLPCGRANLGRGWTPSLKVHSLPEGGGFKALNKWLFKASHQSYPMKRCFRPSFSHQMDLTVYSDNRNGSLRDQIEANN